MPQRNLRRSDGKGEGYPAGGAKPKSTKFAAPEWRRNAFHEGLRYHGRSVISAWGLPPKYDLFVLGKLFEIIDEDLHAFSRHVDSR
jgi:hypothetical protein